MEYYQMLIIPKDCDVDRKTINLIDCFTDMVMRAGDMANIDKYGYISSKVITELIIGKITYPSNIEGASDVYAKMFEYAPTIGSKEYRDLSTCLRDIFNLYKEEIMQNYADKKAIEEIISQYLDLKQRVDNVPEEVSKEIDEIMKSIEDGTDDDREDTCDDEDEDEDEDVDVEE